MVLVCPHRESEECAAAIDGVSFLERNAGALRQTGGYRPAQGNQPMIPGGDLYPRLIRKKPIRIFLQDGTNDLSDATQFLGGLVSDRITARFALTAGQRTSAVIGHVLPATPTSIP